MTTKLLRSIKITTLTVAAGAAIMAAPKMTVYKAIHTSTVNDTADTIGNHAFTKEELGRVFTHNRYGSTELKMHLDSRSRIYFFVAAASGKPPACYLLESATVGSDSIRLRPVRDPSRSWEGPDHVVLKV